jgi:uncharacterized membrane protein YvbJ
MVFKKRTKNHSVGDTASQAGTVNVIKHQISKKKIITLTGLIVLAILISAGIYLWAVKQGSC